MGTGSPDYDIDEDKYGNPEQVLVDFFKPSFFEPPLNLIEIPETCPDSVKKPLRDSFQLFFSSPNAAANSIRIALEELLTQLRVKRYIVNKKGKRVALSLHDRILLLPGRHAGLKDLILAIKWLGNAGSHSQAELTAKDALDAYEMTEHVLREIFSPKIKELQALANKVNKRKGPAR